MSNFFWQHSELDNEILYVINIIQVSAYHGCLVILLYKSIRKQKNWLLFNTKFHTFFKFHNFRTKQRSILLIIIEIFNNLNWILQQYIMNKFVIKVIFQYFLMLFKEFFTSEINFFFYFIHSELSWVYYSVSHWIQDWKYLFLSINSNYILRKLLC